MDDSELTIPFERAFKRLRVDGEQDSGQEGSSDNEDSLFKVCRKSFSSSFQNPKYLKSVLNEKQSNGKHLDCKSYEHKLRKVAETSSSDAINTGRNRGNNNGTELTQNCSHQARNEPDVTVDELAGYLDLQLFLPKKMSFMAELMYT